MVGVENATVIPTLLGTNITLQYNTSGGNSQINCTLQFKIYVFAPIFKVAKPIF